MTLLVTEARPDPLASEIAVEQAHVDLVYARLGEATRSAQQVATAGRFAAQLRP